MRHLRLTTTSLLTALAGALFAHAAGAVTLDVSPTGTGTACTPGSPCAITTANSMARAGDVVRFANGTYTSAPNPTVDGTPSARITYVGNLSIPDAVTIASGMTLKRKYVTVKGMSFTGGVYLDRINSNPGMCAQFDSLAYLNIYHSLGVDQAKDCMVYKCNVTSGLGRFTMSTPATPVADWTTPERDTVRGCTFHLGEQVTDGYHVVQIRGATNCVIDSNRVFIQMAPGLVNEINPFIAFYMRYCQFKDNRWQVMNTDGMNQMVRWRDSSMYNRVFRDSVIMFGSGNCRFSPSSSGSYPGTTTQNYFDGLYVKSSTNPSDYALYYQNGMRRDTLRNCVVIDSIGKAFTNGQVEQGTSLMDHCTIVGNSAWGVAEHITGVNTWGDQWPSSGQLVFTNNILYQLGPGGSNAYGMNWLFSSAANQLTSNGNLVFMPNQSPNRAVNWGIAGATGGTSGVGPGTLWASTFGRDINSVWGSPRFVDSTYTNFDPRPGPGSYAIGRALDGTDIGARRAVGPDATPPSAVGNLNATEVNDNNLKLTWTAPGDDGNIGTVTGYDLRFSTVPINDSNFASAPQATPAPSPLPSGGAQSHVLGGLTPGATYYFAIKARDDVGNWAALSNVKSVVMAPVDTKSPAAIRDLTASP